MIEEAQEDGVAVAVLVDRFECHGPDGQVA